MKEEKMTNFEKIIKEAGKKDMEDIFFVSRKKEEVVYEVYIY